MADYRIIFKAMDTKIKEEAKRQRITLFQFRCKISKVLVEESFLEDCEKDIVSFLYILVNRAVMAGSVKDRDPEMHTIEGTFDSSIKHFCVHIDLELDSYINAWVTEMGDSGFSYDQAVDRLQRAKTYRRLDK